MSHYIYLSCLLVALGCLFFVDFRFKLAYFLDKKRTLITFMIAIPIFLLWDIMGIVLNIFSKGDSAYSLKFEIFKNFPIEEIFFLILLVYTTLILWRLIQRYADVHNS